MPPLCKCKVQTNQLSFLLCLIHPFGQIEKKKGENTTRRQCVEGQEWAWRNWYSFKDFCFLCLRPHTFRRHLLTTLSRDLCQNHFPNSPLLVTRAMLLATTHCSLLPLISPFLVTCCTCNILSGK